MGLCTSYGVGQYAAGQATEAHTVFYDRRYQPNGLARPVVWLHSAGGNSQEPALPANGVLPLLTQLTARGVAVISIDAGGTNWGNAFAQARVTDAVAFLRSNYGAHPTAKAVLLGISMGGLLALNYARANPTLVKATALLYPAVNLQWVHDNGAAATAEAAHGGSLGAFNTAVAGSNPQAHAAEHAGLGIPAKMWRSDSDPTVSAAEQATFAAAAGVPQVVLPGAAHADMTRVPEADLSAFVAGVLV